MPNEKRINYLVTLLFNTTSLIKEKLREQEKSDSLSLSSMRILRYVSEQGQPTMKDLAEYFCITPPSATSLIEHDVDAGLIGRVFDKRDRRIVRLAITVKGKNTLEKKFQNLVKAMDGILAKLNNKQKNQLTDILETLLRTYKK